MKPITREEQYLNKLTGEEQNIAEPITREEQYLSRLCGADNIIPQKPETRRETYLAALCGEEVETPEPVTRIEQYMNFAAGKSQTKPEKAITREEMYWDKYQGGAVPEEKTVQGDIIHITDATGDNAVALSVALTPTQDGTPWISDTLNTEPYLSRAAQNGNTADETIVGGTVCFNQRIQNGDFSDDTNNWTKNSTASWSVSDGELELTVAVNANSNRIYQECTFPINRVYIIMLEAKGDGNLNSFKYVRSTANTLNGDDLYALTTEWQLYTAIVNPKITETTYFIIGTRTRWQEAYSLFVRNVRVMDLTQMFGSTIADYVYALETANEGAGVAWLKTHGFIDDNYHAYNPGELISAKPTAKVVGDTTYALGGADLRGLFKLDEGNNLYCDGDVYTADGTITRKYGIVDLGTLTYAITASGLFSTDSLIPRIRRNSNTARPTNSMITPLYTEVDANSITGPQGAKPSPNMVYAINTAGRLYFNNTSYTSASDFKAAMSGQYLVYELATPTTEASTAYTNPQKAGEAEAFVDARTEKVPVGHSTRYSAEYDINGFDGVTVHVSETQTGGTTYPISFTSQGTVYGGTVDVVSGEMSITYAIEDLGNLEWEYRLSPALGGYVFTAPFTSDYTATSYVTAYAKANNPPAMPYGTYHLEHSGLYIKDPRTTDATEFTRLVTGQKIVYKLAEPITATIDPTTIALNEGENYVWTEEGTTTLTYMAKAAQRVLAMNRTLQKNLNAIELKKGGDVK